MFKYFYAPFLMKKWVRASVVIIFYGWLCSSLAVVPKIEIGLDQEISMPDDSFVLKYFNFLNEYLSVGKFNFFSVFVSNYWFPRYYRVAQKVWNDLIKMFRTKRAMFKKIFIFTPQNCFLRIFLPTAKWKLLFKASFSNLLNKSLIKLNCLKKQFHILQQIKNA